MAEPYRLNDDGPLHALRHDRPGKVYVDLFFDLPGQRIPGHVHAFDHVMRVTEGALLCQVDSQDHVLRPGMERVIAAGKRHALMALASNTRAECEHDVRAENGEIMPDAFNADGIPHEWVRRLTV